MAVEPEREREICKANWRLVHFKIYLGKLDYTKEVSRKSDIFR
jgi:hypothetical protein